MSWLRGGSSSAASRRPACSARAARQRVRAPAAWRSGSSSMPARCSRREAEAQQLEQVAAGAAAHLEQRAARTGRASPSRANSRSIARWRSCTRLPDVGLQQAVAVVGDGAARIALGDGVRLVASLSCGVTSQRLEEAPRQHRIGVMRQHERAPALAHRAPRSAAAAPPARAGRRRRPAADSGATVSPQPASATGSLPASTECSTAQPAIM